MGYKYKQTKKTLVMYFEQRLVFNYGKVLEFLRYITVDLFCRNIFTLR